MCDNIRNFVWLPYLKFVVLVAADPKNKVPTNGPQDLPPGLLNVTCICFEPDPFPGLPGPAVVPGRPKIEERIWG